MEGYLVDPLAYEKRQCTIVGQVSIYAEIYDDGRYEHERCDPIADEPLRIVTHYKYQAHQQRAGDERKRHRRIAAER